MHALHLRINSDMHSIYEMPLVTQQRPLTSGFCELFKPVDKVFQPVTEQMNKLINDTEIAHVERGAP